MARQAARTRTDDSDTVKGNGVTVNAHAKINLILRVLDREPTGYHQIETLFQRIALADVVTVAPTEGTSALTVKWAGVEKADLGEPEQNLAWRAAAAYREVAAWPDAWHIDLVNRVPAGSGLGGGSSDAAAVLRALNQVAPAPLSNDALQTIAAALGSDVPFFVTDASLAIGRGRGERLRTLAPLPVATVALVVPDFAIATVDAYAALAETRSGMRRPAASIRNGDDFSQWASVAPRQTNDFENTVFRRYPPLAAARAALEKAGAIMARLSGSGSTVFGIWDGPGAKPKVDLPKGWKLLLTETA
jgi:4-diphosphocytidyl-2-C-methyl-D-erythritol kinase